MKNMQPQRLCHFVIAVDRERYTLRRNLRMMETARRRKALVRTGNKLCKTQEPSMHLEGSCYKTFQGYDYHLDNKQAIVTIYGSWSAFFGIKV